MSCRQKKKNHEREMEKWSWDAGMGLSVHLFEPLSFQRMHIWAAVYDGRHHAEKGTSLSSRPRPPTSTHWHYGLRASFGRWAPNGGILAPPPPLPGTPPASPNPHPVPPSPRPERLCDRQVWLVCDGAAPLGPTLPLASVQRCFRDRTRNPVLLLSIRKKPRAANSITQPILHGSLIDIFS